MPMTPEEFQKETGVSRETLDKLALYETLLLKWQKAINLVSKNTLDEVWERHFWDSAQLMPFISPEQQIFDLGSGAGFPGLVLAAMGGRVTLVESDRRKALFLGEVARQCGLTAKVENCRIEDLPPALQGQVDVVTARALAPLEALLAYAVPLLKKEGFALFLKGKSWQEELKTAANRYKFTAEDFPSKTQPDARILKISGLETLS